MSDNLEKKSPSASGSVPPEGEAAAAVEAGEGEEAASAPEGRAEGAGGGESPSSVPFGLQAIPEEDDDEENSLMFIDPDFLGGALPSPVAPFDEDEGGQGAGIAVGGGVPEDVGQEGGGGPGPVVGVVHPLLVQAQEVHDEPPPPNVELLEAAGENANDSSDEVRFLCRVPGDGKTRRVATRRPFFLSDDDDDDNDDEDARPIKMACNLAQILPKNAGLKSKGGECSTTSSATASPFEFKQFGSGLLGMPPAGFFIPGAVRRGGGGGGGVGTGSSRGLPLPTPSSVVGVEEAPGGGDGEDDEESLSDSSGRKASPVARGQGEDEDGAQAEEGDGGEGGGGEEEVDVEADDEESLDGPPSA